MPQFYLRNFSGPQKRVVSLYTIRSGTYVPRAAIKHQAYRHRYYESDVRERFLSLSEDRAAPVIRRILATGELPPRSSFDYAHLLVFVMLLRARNPTMIDGSRYAMTESTKLLLRECDGVDDLLAADDLSLGDTMEMSIDQSVRRSVYISDLEPALIEASAGYEFVTSDNPCVMINPYLAPREPTRSVTGLLARGLLIILPLSPRTALALYDDNVYKLGTKRTRRILCSAEDVPTINRLQAVSCIDAVFAKPVAPPLFLSSMVERARRYRRNRRFRAEIVRVFDRSKNQWGEAIRTALEDPCPPFQVRGLKIKKAAASFAADGRFVPRNHSLSELSQLETPSGGSVKVSDIIDEIRKHRRGAGA